MICTSVILCFSSGLTKSDKIMSMFVLFFRLFGQFESLVFFENGGTNFTPKQSNRMFLFNLSNIQRLSNNFSKKSDFFDQTVRTNLTADRYRRLFQQKLCFCENIVAFWTVFWGQRSLL